ncbi:MAG: PAS domain-containing protein, partial [Deltaproteobacteria bacterium]|nr:PAS domain-containing protein [Deltaproteobacteria bacterium]
HSDRPEVRDALVSGRGHAVRFSTTVSDDLSYVALRFEGRSMGGVVRVAKPLKEVSEAISNVLWLLVLAGGLGLLLAIVMSGLASHLMSGTLRSLVSRARHMSTADERSRTLESENELEALSGSFNQMAEEVESTVAELAKERGLIKAVLKGMSEAVVALDNDFDITLMNPAAVELLGLESENRGRSILEILRVPGLQKLLGKDPITGPSSAEFQLPNQRHVLASLRPQRGAEGSVLVMHDVTDIRRLETVRRDFVANVSHELRTPVAIIRANAETLLEGALEDPKFSRSLVDALHRNAERLSNIITDLLDLSRIEAGRYQLALEPVVVDGIADHAAKSIERAAAEKDISIEVAVGPEVCALADSKALEQVLFNLLDNAVKYTPEGGAVRITAEVDGDHYQIGVEDNGPGIEARHRERIFERFYRVDPGRSRGMGGTGLGLAIVRHLVEAMGGEVSVENAKPNGSIFVIRVPRAGVEPDGVGTEHAAEPATEVR